MAQVRLEGYLEVPAERLAEVAAALPLHIGLTRAEPGCLSFEVTQDPSTPTHFLVAERFASQAAFDQHQARAGASEWAQVTAGLERHYTITTDEADQPTDTADSAMQDGPRFSVPDILRARIALEGENGQAWLDGLGDLLTSVEQDWDITIGAPLSGGSAAFVAEATTGSGDPVVIKLGTPGAYLGRREAEVLTHAGGKGYVQLLRHDPSRRALLLERLDAPLETLALPYQQQVSIMCATLLDAWMPVPDGFAGINGADKANSLAETILRLWSAAGQPCAQPVIDTALLYCQDRAAAYRPQNAVLAHGDPHPANILGIPGSDFQRFKFIDPDGLAIEPAYDLGVVLRAWHEGIGGRNAHDIARSHTRHLTTRTQVPAEAIWQWGYIERVSTGLHLLELGQTEQARTYLETAEAIVSTAR